MPGRVLLDTNVIIAFFSGERAASQQFMDAEVFVSSTVLGELYYGARKSAHAAANLARIEEFAASVQVLSCDAATAQIYGKIRAGSASKIGEHGRTEQIAFGRCNTLKGKPVCRSYTVLAKGAHRVLLQPRIPA